MRIKFKVIAIVFIVLLGTMGSIGYTILQRIEKHKRAQKVADRVIENLDKPSVLSDFREEYFPREELTLLLDSLTKNGNWQQRDGLFVDFSTEENIGGVDEISFIYEYYLPTDSLRFILAMNLTNEPLLQKFEVEQIEVDNPRILKPGKQLKYRDN